MLGSPNFTASGPTFSFFIPAGEQTIVIVPSGALLSGLRMTLDAEYATATRTVGATVALVDANGNPVSSAIVGLRLVLPTGETHSTPAMAQSDVPGIYYANATLGAGVDVGGPWLVVASYGGTIASRIVNVPGSAPVEISTAIDPYMPLILWGGLMLFCIWLAAENITAWLPASFALMNLVSTMLEPPLFTHTYRVFLFLLGFMMHALVVGTKNWRNERRARRNDQ